MFSTNFTWVEALPLVLYSMHQQKGRDTHLSPHELLTGRPMPGPPRDTNLVPDTALQHTEIGAYMRMLTKMTEFLSKQVQAARSTGEDTAEKGSSLSIGDWVWVKAPGKPKWHEPLWTGPYQIAQVFHRAVRVQKEGDKV